MQSDFSLLSIRPLPREGGMGVLRRARSVLLKSDALLPTGSVEPHEQKPCLLASHNLKVLFRNIRLQYKTYKTHLL